MSTKKESQENFTNISEKLKREANHQQSDNSLKSSKSTGNFEKKPETDRAKLYTENSLSKKKSIVAADRHRKPKSKKIYIASFVIIFIVLLTVFSVVIGLVIKFLVIDKQNVASKPIVCSFNCPFGYEAIAVNENCRCLDTDECKKKTDNCEDGYMCINSVGSFSCVDINECNEDVNICGYGKDCVNSVGSYKCMCKFGFEEYYENDASLCRDINECQLSSVNQSCPNGYNCANTEGSYECCRVEQITNECYSCGLQYTKPLLKIVGGNVSRPYSWPWVVSIGINFLTRQGSANQPRWVNVTHFCGGVLISNTHVLTAAHCVNRRRVYVDSVQVDLQENEYHPTFESIFTLYTGIFNQIQDKTNPESVFKIESIQRHADFNQTSLLNDIAILKLSRPVKKTIRTDFCCVPNFNLASIPTGIKVYAAGFGLESSNALFGSNLLRQVDLNIYPFDKCNSVTSDTQSNQNSQLCVGDLAGFKDTCRGDSGTPLMHNYLNRWYVIGLVSYGKGCGQPNTPAVYTNVMYFKDWVMNYV